MRVSEEELRLGSSSLPAWTGLCYHLAPCLCPRDAPQLVLWSQYAAGGPKPLGRGHSVMGSPAAAPPSCLHGCWKAGQGSANRWELLGFCAQRKPWLKIHVWGESHAGRKSACVSVAFLYRKKSTSYFYTWAQSEGENPSLWHSGEYQ